ncbi:helix-turn-helix transcriptional regulator [Polaribacter sp. IC073]|uniref:helix-turn-helix transcriptional regulator n=1 Tax=Polaribacter sp. IC073 TaxID=2508540 RepID=UPI0011BF37C0|nr:helix-turn-helix transcriptional regulator [Polaribacter sp. IC073]TXD45874.1 helix-turn-helix transcriptional regulator [Polaribacter sp. IC073]
MKPINIEYYNFSKRESDVIRELMKGNIMKEIADILCIAFSTVDSRIRSAKKKTGAKNIAQLVYIYILQNLAIYNKVKK